MRSELQHIVAATDFSAGADLAVQRAAGLAQARGLPLHLLHALEPGDWVTRAAQLSVSHFDAEARRRSALQALEALRGRLLARHGGIGIELEVVDGPLHRCLHDRAAQGDGELLVIGATGQGRWRRALLGSTADRLLRLGLQPVWLVRRPADRPYSRLVLTTDFSPASNAAARFAAMLWPSAQHFLFHACQTPLADSLAFAGLPDEAREAYRQREWNEAMRQLAVAAEALAEASPGLTLAPREGVAGKALAEFVAAAGVDLVTLGLTPRPRWEANLLGSTALFALGGLDCDLLLVPVAVEG